LFHGWAALSSILVVFISVSPLAIGCIGEFATYMGQMQAKKSGRDESGRPLLIVITAVLNVSYWLL
jgi:hypothetical protein